MAQVTQRDAELSRLVSDVAGALTDLVAWPTSEAAKLTADNEMKLLKKAFREAGYPHSFQFFATMQIASLVYSEATTRKAKMEAMKDVWVKLGELI
jgi:hypothetical protein